MDGAEFFPIEALLRPEIPVLVQLEPFVSLFPCETTNSRLLRGAVSADDLSDNSVLPDLRAPVGFFEHRQLGHIVHDLQGYGSVVGRTVLTAIHCSHNGFY
uniref:Peptidase S1 domain-containing protein n=1 Tax=Steinernema glaseri TaxID=37863 RepID=A0A1I7Z644_9BILA